MTPFEVTVESQRQAATPSRSAFVMANAGSGKTRVLTNRVARLLLADTEPQKILCITFTKAAAAEMAERLFNVLGAWALSSDADLDAALTELEGAARYRDAAELTKARRLFARALETPGGLKIQTIHSFCESVLRRFPLEAGAPPGFTVIEDAESAALLNASLDALASRRDLDASLVAAFDRLSAEHSEDRLRDLLLGGATQNPNLGGQPDIKEMVAALAAALGVNPADDAETVKAAFIKTISADELKRAHDGLAAEGAQPQKAAVRLAPFFSATTLEQQWAALEAFLLTSDGSKPHTKHASAATDKHDPWVRPFIVALQERFMTVIQQLKALKLFLDTAAFWRLSLAVRRAYENAKAARAALDFNDLVLRARALFQRVESAWIMYKLDDGIDHILVDEAQDTSPHQWAVIESLFEEFFSGDGAREKKRSFFAVGDLKQSIYSFQGADVTLFKQKEQDIGERLARVTDFKSVSLDLSFRTTVPVLSFVDAAFANKEAAEGLGDVVPAHGVKREGEAGLVELWPLTPRPEKPDVNPWDAPVDAPISNHPVRVLSERIAATVKQWLDTSEVLPSQGRPITPGDVLILVQSRGPLFAEVIQRLSSAGVPVAGPDRLKLNEDPAVEDLISYARFALCASDNLSLAEVLKSPLFGFDDDRDLFPLGYERGQSESLWASLRRRGGEQSHWASAADELGGGRTVAATQGPFAFFTHILETGARSGRQRFYDRMGKASSDAIDELLRQAIDFENGNPRSLRAFVDWFDRTATDIKREMERQHDAVRVMTVHGAKGLEAEIVFLLDAHREVNLQNIGPVIDVESPKGVFPVLAGAKGNDVALTEAARAELVRKKYEEYRRLFYVAATRARDRLYICGVESGKNKKPQDKPVNQKTWHALAEDAFGRLDDVEEASTPFWEGGQGAVRRIVCPQKISVKTNEAVEAMAVRDPPAWLFTKAKAETAPKKVSPSKLGGEDEEGASQATDGPAGPAYSPLRGHDRYFRGRVLHRMLELLPDVPDAQRPAAADRLLARLAGGIDE